MLTRLKINKEDDRLTVAAILIKNGYRVAQRKEKSATGKSYIYYLEVDDNGQYIPRELDSR